MIRAEVHWMPVHLLTGYQRLAGELQVRGVLREMLNDPESHLRMRNLSTEPLLPGAPRLSGIPEGLVTKELVSVIVPRGDEPAPPDEHLERSRKFVLVQGDWFTARGFAEFPAAADESLHRDLLLKTRFFHLHDVNVSAVGAEGARWDEPSAWINRDLVLALYLG